MSPIEYDVTTNRTRRLVSVVLHQQRLALAQIDMTPEQLDEFVQQLQEAKASLPPAEQPP
jgi:hypothetical protein